MKAAKQLQLSLFEILEYRKLHPEMQTDKASLILTQFHGRIAQPFTCLVVVLVALPFGAAVVGAMFLWGWRAVWDLFYLFHFNALGLALGTAGHMPPVLAAWLPNLVFAGTGVVLLRRVP